MRAQLGLVLIATMVSACTGNVIGKAAPEDISAVEGLYAQCTCDADEISVPTVCPAPTDIGVPASAESSLYTKLVRSYKPGVGHWATAFSAPTGYQLESSWYLPKTGNCEKQQLLWECTFLNRSTYLSHSAACIGGGSQRAVGYVYRWPVTGAIPLYQCFVEQNADFFVSPKANCEGQRTLGLIGYVMPSPVNPPPAPSGNTSCTCPGPTPDAGVPPHNPDASVPQNPDASVPQNPDASVPQNPDASVPQNPDASVPQNPDASVPQNPDASVPQNPDAGTGPVGECPAPENNGPLKGLPYPAVDARGVKGIAYAPGDANTRIPLLKNAGTKVVGYNIPWIVVEPSRKNAPCSGGEVTYDGRCYKDVVGSQIKQLNDSGIRVTAILYGVPEWAHVGNTACSPMNDSFKMFCAPDNADDFARFAGMLAQRYDGQGGRGRIHNFVIHNEVNSNIWFDIGCGNGTTCNVDAWISRYADNYNRAYDRIKSHQSEAKVLVSLEQNFGEPAQNLNTTYPLIAGANFLTKLAPLLGTRNWQVAFHPYPKNLLKPEFSPFDWPNVTYGNAGQIVGWLRQHFPNDPHAWIVQFTESGINSSSPNSSEALQSTRVCESTYNVFGTPLVSDYIYHGMYDDGLDAQLQVGLFRADNSKKPAWDVWAKQNDCGYQYAPYTHLVRSYKPGTGHWASSRLAPAGYNTEKAWLLDRNGDCHTQQVLWECNVGNRTTYLSKDPTCSGATNMGPVGYANLAQQSGQIGLYQCKVNNNDYFVSDSANCEGQTVVGALGFVRASP